MSEFAFSQLRNLAGHRLGVHDVACPVCGPHRHQARNRVRTVLRIYYEEPSFAGFYCARCGLSGYGRDGNATPPSPERLAAQRADSDKRQRADWAERLRIARYLWGRRRPAENTVVDRFLRDTRNYHGPIPTTIGYLPGNEKYPPTMIAAVGIPDEPEPGILLLRDASLAGVHLTQLLADGSGKARAAFLIGHSLGSPLVVAPMSDLLGLVISEGLETGLSLYEATHCGVWVSGSHTRMPALADAVPDFVDCVTVGGEPDEGLESAKKLVRQLTARGIHAELRVLREKDALP